MCQSGDLDLPKSSRSSVCLPVRQGVQPRFWATGRLWEFKATQVRGRVVGVSHSALSCHLRGDHGGGLRRTATARSIRRIRTGARSAFRRVQISSGPLCTLSDRIGPAQKMIFLGKRDGGRLRRYTSLKKQCQAAKERLYHRRTSESIPACVSLLLYQGEVCHHHAYEDVQEGAATARSQVRLPV